MYKLCEDFKLMSRENTGFEKNRPKPKAVHACTNYGEELKL